MKTHATAPARLILSVSLISGLVHKASAKVLFAHWGVNGIKVLTSQCPYLIFKYKNVVFILLLF